MDVSGGNRAALWSVCTVEPREREQSGCEHLAALQVANFGGEPFDPPGGLQRVDFQAQPACDVFLGGALMQAGARRQAGLPDVPLVIDHAASADDRTLIELLFFPQEMGRTFVMPPTISPRVDCEK